LISIFPILGGGWVVLFRFLLDASLSSFVFGWLLTQRKRNFPPKGLENRPPMGGGTLPSPSPRTPLFVGKPRPITAFVPSHLSPVTDFFTSAVIYRNIMEDPPDHELDFDLDALQCIPKPSGEAGKKEKNPKLRKVVQVCSCLWCVVVFLFSHICYQ
jgi:hypothetical protein